MFLGDARPHSPNDEWVFNDVDSIQEMIIPAARIALKVHQVRGIIIVHSAMHYFWCCKVYELLYTVFAGHVLLNGRL